LLLSPGEEKIIGIRIKRRENAQEYEAQEVMINTIKKNTVSKE
jgi:hypothetical protein